MKSLKKKYILKPKTTFLDILKRLLKEPIAYDEFLNLLEMSLDPLWKVFNTHVKTYRTVRMKQRKNQSQFINCNIFFWRILVTICCSCGHIKFTTTINKQIIFHIILQ